MPSKKTIQKATEIINKLYGILSIDYCPTDLYAGITDNVERRKAEHKADKSFCFEWIDCGTYECACEVETLLANEGFDVGKRPANGGNDNSCFVYAYEKNPYTIENTNAES